ncbi:hypothetical protein EZS27_018754 [termite gut metagenome]|uniref:Uncharacterized protein n=1 Tax=termite gut metagenome TaxID=433724 RepID=A0A5J4RHI2_9ZZZZ
MINIPVKISLPEIWQGEFEKNEWNSINFIVGANGTGKSIFSEKLKEQLKSKQLKVRLLTAERLSGLEKQSYSEFNSNGLQMPLAKGFDLSKIQNIVNNGETYGLSSSAFITLKERLDIRIKIEALLSDVFKKTIRLVEEGGFLKPKMQNINGGGKEYVLKEKECHGLKEIITLLTFLYDDKHNCIIFDEPELHLHPQFQSFFLNEIRKLTGNPFADSSKKLFFIITHSPYFLDLRTIDDLKNILVCHTNKMPTYIKNGDLDSQDEYILSKFLPHFNTHHKQFFFSPNPVFVEGYTDQQIITLLFEKSELNIAASGSCVIDVGGKDELAVFFKLCKKLNIDCRIIADYDAFFRGRLREFFSKDQRVIDCFVKEALGTDVSVCIGEIERKLIALADILIIKISPDPILQELITLLIKLYQDKSANIESVKDAMILSLYRIGDKIESLLPQPIEVISIKNKHLKCVQCIESANIHIIYNGELEHYFKAFSIDYLNITNKDKLFHAERDYILGLDKSNIESNYADLLLLLAKSIPHVDVNMIKHLRYVIVEWIQNVQNAIIRKEVTDISTLKTNARVNYVIYSQLFDCENDSLSINSDGTFNCTIKIKSSLVGTEKEVSFDHTTTAQNFKLE